jgi:hypothetical protein
MNSKNSTGDFVENWLVKLRNKYSKSQTVAAVSDATQSGQLNEIKLLKRLRELSKPAKKDKPDDQG